MSVKIKRVVANLEQTDVAHTFNLERLTSLGTIARLVKYFGFILRENANYRTPLKMSRRRAISDRMLQIEAPLTKNNS